MSEGKLSTFKIASAYIGIVVGAGFASGQEVLQFFGYFGYWGLAGVAAAAVLFIYFGGLLLLLGRKLNAESHLPVIRYVGGKWLGVFIDYVITFFLFGAFTVMAAGAGALFAEQFGLPKILGNVVLVGASLLTVLLGLNGVISAISIVVPVLLVSVLGIGIYTVVSAGISPAASVQAAGAGKPAVPFWPLAAFVYVSYNLVMAAAVLAPMGRAAADPGVIRKGAFWGGLGLGVGAAAIFLAMLVTMPESARFEIPMIYIAGQAAPFVRIIYAFVLLAEIYTTAVGSLYGFAVRFTSPQSSKMKLFAGGSSIAALAAAQFGFIGLVRVLFPLVGYAGIALLGGLVYRQIIPSHDGRAESPLPQPAFKKKNK